MDGLRCHEPDRTEADGDDGREYHTPDEGCRAENDADLERSGRDLVVMIALHDRIVPVLRVLGASGQGGPVGQRTGGNSSAEITANPNMAANRAIVVVFLGLPGIVARPLLLIDGARPFGRAGASMPIPHRTSTPLRRALSSGSTWMVTIACSISVVRAPSMRSQIVWASSTESFPETTR